MGLVSPAQSADGETIEAADINGPVNTIANEFNGNIEAVNLKDSAVTTAKLANSSVTPAKISNVNRFSAYKSTGTQSVTTAAAAKITFDTEEYDTSSNFASSTYTAPVAGVYLFIAGIAYGGASVSRFIPFIYKNGSLCRRGEDRFANALSGNAIVTTMVLLAAGDTVEIYGQSVGATATVTAAQDQTYFQGILLQAT